MARSGAQLIVLEPDRPERVVGLGPVCTVGRSSKSDVVIDHLDCSRRHAEFRRRSDGRFELVDLGSRNGCFVNGTRIENVHVLEEGDRIDIAEVILRFSGPRSEDAARAVPAASEVGASLDLAPDIVAALTEEASMALGDASSVLGESTEPDLMGTPGSLELEGEDGDVPAFILLASVGAARGLENELAADWRTDAERAIERFGGWVQRGGESSVSASVLGYWLIDRPERPAREVLHALQAVPPLVASAQQVAPLVAASGGADSFEVRIALDLGPVELRNRPDGGGNFEVRGDAIRAATQLLEQSNSSAGGVIASHRTLEAVPELACVVAEGESLKDRRPQASYSLDVRFVAAVLS